MFIKINAWQSTFGKHYTLMLLLFNFMQNKQWAFKSYLKFLVNF